ncbi:MAG: acetyl-CoA carboxylase biotin carboxyl carrier protein [Ruminococcus sp.]|nr:acetyl-CoA carboxylase biotin carboxyl carrier protein [Ruminococcus sp.]MDE6101879.1 acetyl-CoA carboxylase biotin carboxyl carrier protein [Ruminococcus sp.]
MEIKDKNENNVILNTIDIETVERLAEIVSENDLGEICIKSTSYGSVTIKGKKNIPAPPSVMPVGVSAPVAQQNNVSTPADEKSENSGNIVKSPIVGTFYAAPSPDKPAFVKVGDKVKKGDVIMIIESMKLMNEIQSDFDGVVEKILVSDGQAVEYDQPVMIIK